MDSGDLPLPPDFPFLSRARGGRRSRRRRHGDDDEIAVEIASVLTDASRRAKAQRRRLILPQVVQIPPEEVERQRIKMRICDEETETSSILGVPGSCLSMNFKNYCAFLGCHSDAKVQRYCCVKHKDLAGDAVTTTRPFLYSGGFADSQERDRFCTTCIYNKREGVDSGVPSFTHGEMMFSAPPWELPFFNPSLRPCEWLFFLNTHITLKEMMQGSLSPLRWMFTKKVHSMSGICLRKGRLLSETKQGIESKQGVESEKAKEWSLYLYNSDELNLFCVVHHELEVNKPPKQDSATSPNHSPNSSSSSMLHQGQTVRTGASTSAHHEVDTDFGAGTRSSMVRSEVPRKEKQTKVPSSMLHQADNELEVTKIPKSSTKLPKSCQKKVLKQ